MKRKTHSTQEIVRQLREAERLTAQGNRIKSEPIVTADWNANLARCKYQYRDHR